MVSVLGCEGLGSSSLEYSWFSQASSQSQRLFLLTCFPTPTLPLSDENILHPKSNHELGFP